jgi:hypothetical protein
MTFNENYPKERDAAFIDFVKNDDDTKLKAFCKKYNVPMPKDSKTRKAAVYKAVRYCTDIPQDVKDMAFRKCLELGFIPFIINP